VRRTWEQVLRRGRQKGVSTPVRVLQLKVGGGELRDEEGKDEVQLHFAKNCGVLGLERSRLLAKKERDRCSEHTACV
jgi:hypothetical protein